MTKTTQAAPRGDHTSTSLDSGEAAALDNLVEERVQSVKIVGKNNDAALSGKRAVININMVANETGSASETANAPLFIGLNGYGYHIPRGVNVSVPVEVLDILDNAIQRTYPTRNGIVVGEVDVPRHAYRVVSKEA